MKATTQKKYPKFVTKPELPQLLTAKRANRERLGQKAVKPAEIRGNAQQQQKKPMNHMDKVEQSDMKFIEKNEDEALKLIEDSIDELILEETEEERIQREFAESVLKADSDSRMRNEAISKAALDELHKSNSEKEESKQVSKNIDKFLTEF